MNIYLEKVKEFMLTFGQPVLDKPTSLTQDRQRLRIALIFEELKEYAESSGELEYFNLLALNSQQEFQENYWDKDITYVPIVDQVEQLDALLDLQYVISGAIHEHGFGEIFDAGFDEVHNSNMSKACSTQDQIDRTFDFYDKEDTAILFDEKDGKYIVKRLKDHKVLKNIDYKPAQLAQFLK